MTLKYFSFTLSITLELLLNIPAVVVKLSRLSSAVVVTMVTGVTSSFFMLRKSSAVSMMVVRNHTQMLLATMWVRPKRTNALCLLIVIWKYNNNSFLNHHKFLCCRTLHHLCNGCRDAYTACHYEGEAEEYEHSLFVDPSVNTIITLSLPFL